MWLPARRLHGACVLDRAGRYRGLVRHEPKGRSGSAVEVARKAAKWCADATGSPTVGSLMSVRRYEATDPKRLRCCRPCQWTTTRLLPDTTGGVEKSLRRLPRDLRWWAAYINPYFLLKKNLTKSRSDELIPLRVRIPPSPFYWLYKALMVVSISYPPPYLPQCNGSVQGSPANGPSPST